MRRLSLMVRVADAARADIALTPERTYYRFATDDSIEDGELAPIQDDFETILADIKAGASAREGERPLAADVRAQLFEDNRLCTAPWSEESLHRVIATVAPLTPEFAFLRAFA